MKQKDTVPENAIVIDISLTRGLVLLLGCVLVAAALFAYLTLTGESAMASEAEAAQAGSTGMRQYYLTKSTHNGAHALDACALGYHFASMWEMADPSNLKYNVDLGYQWGDVGQGPPSGRVGWVRTGYLDSTGVTPGRANCDVWTSESGTDDGTVAILNSNWTTSLEMGVWVVYAYDCAQGHYVWCIED